VRLRLPDGLPNDSLLVLRNDEEWLDYRYFQSPLPGQERDNSVVWDQPGTEVDLLLAGGEGPTVEFKQEVPTDPASRKKVVKTVVAFASGGGGTVLFGVADDAQVIGIEPTARDKSMLAVGSMIRSTVEPEPPYEQRTVEWRGKMVLLVEVKAGGRWYALNPAKPEFYVRRGASTVPARLDEIASGFGQQQLGTRFRVP
jgi:predicted HTH transcriptional regulator